MRRIHLLGTALGAALVASPAFAQQMPPPGSPQGYSWSQGGPQAGAWTEQDRRAALRQDLRSGGHPPAVPRQDRYAAMADDMSVRGPIGWLSRAEDAARRGRWVEANELVERAETRVLSRVEPSTMADEPIHGPVVRHTSAARSALAARDREGAMHEIDMAMQALRDRWGGGSATGGNAGTTPMQGGGMGYGQGMPGGNWGGYPSGPGQSAPGQGSVIMRDQGYGGSSMARADHLVSPASPARPLHRAQAAGGGGAPANSMTESQRATPNRTPTPAMPGAHERGMTPAPMPGTGATTTIPGATSNGSVGGTAGVGTPGGGGGTGAGGSVGTGMGGMGGSGVSGSGSR